MEPAVDLDYTVLFEDDKCVVINKSGDLPVHEGGLYKENTLVRLLEKNYGRLYPVYRLDRETSGVIVYAKKRELVKEFKISQKEYYAVVEGLLKDRVVVNEPIGEVSGEHVKWKMAVIKTGRESKTIIEPIKLLKIAALVRVLPLTGRQHQIRVHLQYIKHPIIGDKLYGNSDKLFKDYLDGKKLDLPIKRQALHLYKIRLDSREITAEIPLDIKELIAKLG